MKIVKRKHIKNVKNRKNELSPFMYGFELTYAWLADYSIFIIKSIAVLGFIIAFICTMITLFVWIKIKPDIITYRDEADKVVAESTKDTFIKSGTTYIYDKDDKVIAKLKGEYESEYLDYEDISPYAVNAFIAIEDRSFWDNPGIDLKGIIRVVIAAIKTKGEEKHGASTITQQLARNIYLTHEVSLERKEKEIMYSLALTKKYTKEDIMEFYVNNICFANAIYGLEAASKAYFNKESRELTLSQIAYLCAIPNRPEYYNPYKEPDRAIPRRDKILKDMYNLNFITRKQYKDALDEEITIEKPKQTFNNYQTTFALDCATKFIMEKNKFQFRYTFSDMSDYNTYRKEYNEEYEKAHDKLMGSGYKIHTTLDSSIQKKMQKILNEQLSFDKEKDSKTKIYSLQGAMTVIDNDTGKVIAVIGGRSQKKLKSMYSLNRAYQSYRQPGSTIKPLVVYGPALENGYTTNSIVYDININEAKKKGVNAQELKGTSMTLRQALEQSKNGVAWQVFDKIKPSKALNYITDMKFSKICPDDYNDASSLGGLTDGVTTVEMAGAYATLVNHGRYREPTCIESIELRGNNIYKDKQIKTVYEDVTADTVTDMMQGVLIRGTATKLNWYESTNTVAACKTGTTNDSKDGWLCGYTPYYTIAVWVGYDTPKTLSSLYGATYPGQIWKNCMLELIKDKPEKPEFSMSAKYIKQLNNNKPTIDNKAYDLYLPGRHDDEVLSPGYTVRDYRIDRIIGESVTEIISTMYNLNNNDINYQRYLVDLYEQGKAKIDEIYSIKYTAEMRGLLDDAYSKLSNTR